MRFDFRVVLIVVATMALGLLLSTSANIAVAQQPDAKAGGESVALPQLPAGFDEAALAKAVQYAEQLALDAGAPAQDSDVEEGEAPVVSPRLPSDGYDITNVFVALRQSGVPCFGCVSGAGPGNAVGVPFPRSVVRAGGAVEYVVLQEVGSAHAGACTVVYVVLRGNQVVDSDFAQTTCNANTVRFNAFNKTAPGSSGDMVLLGMLIAGDGTRDVNFSLFTVR